MSRVGTARTYTARDAASVVTAPFETKVDSVVSPPKRRRRVVSGFGTESSRNSFEMNPLSGTFGADLASSTGDAFGFNPAPFDIAPTANDSSSVAVVSSDAVGNPTSSGTINSAPGASSSEYPRPPCQVTIPGHTYKPSFYWVDRNRDSILSNVCSTLVRVCYGVSMSQYPQKVDRYAWGTLLNPIKKVVLELNKNEYNYLVQLRLGVLSEGTDYIGDNAVGLTLLGVVNRLKWNLMKVYIREYDEALHKDKRKIFEL